MFEIRKYKEFGEWGAWKPVSKEVAERKLKIRIKGDWCDFCPYEVREVEEVSEDR